MSGVVIHYGVDSSYRLHLLQNAGFEVVDCGTSLSDFNRAIVDHEVCAVAVSQNASRRLATLRELRSRTSVPVIVFAGIGVPERFPEVDLVIPALTPPPDWLTQIAELIKKSREIAEEAALIRRQSATLKRQSVALRATSASERQRSANERSKLQLDADSGDKRGNLF